MQMMKQPKINPRGSNLSGVAQYNERLILQHIRRAGSLTKADIARLTQLSAQTASVIINRLIEQQLLYKQERIQGKMGQPAIPIALNPEGAYSIGVKIGRRSTDIILINFVGAIIQRISHTYDYPDPEFIFPVTEQAIATLLESLNEQQQERLIGIGVASPYSLGGWQQEADLPAHVTKLWHEVDIKQRLQTHQHLPVWQVNDATAACIASLEFGHNTFNTYLYIFVGTFIGGGVIMERTLYDGSFHNAGAIASMPIPAHYAPDVERTTTSASMQLLNCASRYLLNRRYKVLGLDADQVLSTLGAAQEQNRPLPDTEYAIFQTWLQQAAAAIGYAITAATSVIDFEGVVIDGLFPPILTEQLTQEVQQAMLQLDLEGLIPPKVVAGHLGNDARALGGALLPFYTNFAPDRNILMSTKDHHLYAFQGH